MWHLQKPPKTDKQMKYPFARTFRACQRRASKFDHSFQLTQRAEEEEKLVQNSPIESSLKALQWYKYKNRWGGCESRSLVSLLPISSFQICEISSAQRDLLPSLREDSF